MIRATNNFDTERFAATVRALRGGRSLSEFSGELERGGVGTVTPSTLSRIERGQRPSLETLLTICDFANLPAGSFLTLSRTDGEKLPASAERVIARIRAAPAIADAIETITALLGGGVLTPAGDRVNAPLRRHQSRQEGRGHTGRAPLRDCLKDAAGRDRGKRVCRVE